MFFQVSLDLKLFVTYPTKTASDHHCSNMVSFMITLMTIPLLNYFLGRVNGSLKCLEVYFPHVMKHFFTLFGYKRYGMPGGNKDFIGRLCREIISVEKLAELQNLLGDDGTEFVRFLSAIRELHKSMVGGELEDYSYEDNVYEYSDAFNDVHELYGLPETVKCHIYRYQFCQV